jgi:hypothetical protein
VTSSTEIAKAQDTTNSRQTLNPSSIESGAVTTKAEDRGTNGSFAKYATNIIVGNLGLPTADTNSAGVTTINPPQKGQGAVFYDNKSKQTAEINKATLNKLANYQ